MKYTLKRPCDNCPFLKQGHIPLRPGRVTELSENMLSQRGGEFTCHKTTVSSDTTDSGRVDGPNALHCAGALIYAEKQGNATQMMRIAERLGMYDAAALMADKDVVASVFDDEEDMQAGHERSNRKHKPEKAPKRRKRAP